MMAGVFWFPERPLIGHSCQGVKSSGGDLVPMDLPWMSWTRAQCPKRCGSPIRFLDATGVFRVERLESLNGHDMLYMRIRKMKKCIQSSLSRCCSSRHWHLPLIGHLQHCRQDLFGFELAALEADQNLRLLASSAPCRQTLSVGFVCFLEDQW